MRVFVALSWRSVFDVNNLHRRGIAAIWIVRIEWTVEKFLMTEYALSRRTEKTCGQNRFKTKSPRRRVRF